MELSEAKFEGIADATLEKMVETVSDLEDDALEADLESGVLTLRFDDGVKYVINSHRAARQIWMAAGASAWHFDYDGEAWISTKTGEELWSLVEHHMSKKLGRNVQLLRT